MSDVRLVSRVGRNYEWTGSSVAIAPGVASVEIAAPTFTQSSGGRFVIVSQIKLHISTTSGRVKLPNRHIIFQRTNPDGSDASPATDQLIPCAGSKRFVIGNDFDPYDATEELAALHETGLRVYMDDAGKRELQWLYISFALVRA